MGKTAHPHGVGAFSFRCAHLGCVLFCTPGLPGSLARCCRCHQAGSWLKSHSTSRSQLVPEGLEGWSSPTKCPRGENLARCALARLFPGRRMREGLVSSALSGFPPPSDQGMAHSHCVSSALLLTHKGRSLSVHRCLQSCVVFLPGASSLLQPGLSPAPRMRVVVCVRGGGREGMPAGRGQ